MRNLELKNLKKIADDLEKIGSYENWGKPSLTLADSLNLPDREKHIFIENLTKIYQNSTADLKEIRQLLLAIIKDNQP